MTEACFVLFLGSGLCLTFSAFVLMYAIQLMNRAKIVLDFAWYLAHRTDRTPEKPEISD